VLGVPILCTVLGMTVMPYVPASVPLVMGTAELGEQARKVQRGKVWVLEPPIDVTRDHPGIDGSAFRHLHRVREDELLVVSVSRLAVDLKLDALVRAIDATDLLAGRHPLRLILVGDGPARNASSTRAAAVNRRWGREVVTLAGADLDPRPAYAAADVVVGMGSSALRGLAIGRPVVVQGEDGFSEVFDPSAVDLFLRQGFYGLGEGAVGAGRLADQLAGLLEDRKRREMLGAFGRKIVVERFSLERAAHLQLEIYKDVLSMRSTWGIGDAALAGWKAFALEVANHDPRRKRAKAMREQRLFAAAQTGPWPPQLG
jgi:glycosyltransferase involved in cell wall biosynthesis